MVFILKAGVSEEAIKNFRQEFENIGFDTIYAPGTEHTAVCLIGNTAKIDMDTIVATHPIVDYGKRVTETYKAAGRTVHPDNTIVKVGERHIHSYCRTMQCRDKRTDHNGGGQREKKRCRNPSRRRIQAENVTICLPRAWKRRT